MYVFRRGPSTQELVPVLNDASCSLFSKRSKTCAPPYKAFGANRQPPCARSPSPKSNRNHSNKIKRSLQQVLRGVYRAAMHIQAGPRVLPLVL